MKVPPKPTQGADGAPETAIESFRLAGTPGKNRVLIEWLLWWRRRKAFALCKGWQEHQ
jgi:hypothetical protein